MLGAGHVWSRFLAAPAQGRALETVWRAGAKVTPLIEGGQWWRLVIAPLHHVDPGHLAVNLVIVGLMGGFCATLLGNRLALAVFLGGAWLSTAASAWLNPAAWSLGASGGGYALTGALIGALATGGSLRGLRPQLALLGVACLIGLQISWGGPGADRIAHASGVVAGFAVGALVAWRRAHTGGRGARAGLGSRLAWGLAAAGVVGVVGWGEWAQYRIEPSFGESTGASAAMPHESAADTGCTWARPRGWVRESPAELMAGGVCQTNGLARACLLPAADLSAVEAHWFGSNLCPDEADPADDDAETTAWRLRRRARLGETGTAQHTLWIRPGVAFAFAESHLVEYEFDSSAVPGIYALRESVRCPDLP